MSPQHITLTFEGREAADEAYSHYSGRGRSLAPILLFEAFYLVAVVEWSCPQFYPGDPTLKVTLSRVINASGNELDAAVTSG